MPFKPLVVFYSRTGNNRALAREIARRLGAKLAEIVDLKRRSGPMGWMRSGYDGMRERLTHIKLDADLAEHDPILIGTPIWAGKMTPAVRTFLTEHELSGKRIAFFSVSGFGRAEAAFDEMKNMAQGTELIATLSLSLKEFGSERSAEKVASFIDLIKQRS